MTYFAISDLVGNLLPSFFSTDRERVIFDFYVSKTGYAGRDGSKCGEFWQESKKQGFSLVALEIPDPLPLKYLPHQVENFDYPIYTPIPQPTQA